MGSGKYGKDPISGSNTDSDNTPEETGDRPQKAEPNAFPKAAKSNNSDSSSEAESSTHKETRSEQPEKPFEQPIELTSGGDDQTDTNLRKKPIKKSGNTSVNNSNDRKDKGSVLESDTNSDTSPKTSSKLGIFNTIRDWFSKKFDWKKALGLTVTGVGGWWVFGWWRSKMRLFHSLLPNLLLGLLLR